LINIFSKYGSPKEVAKVLAGKFISLPQCNPYAAKFLSVVLQPPNLEDVAPRSNLSYSHGWQKAREATGSLALGIHFGHYLAGTYNTEILVINVTLADVPLQTDFTYNRWKKGLNIMIEKMTRDFSVEKLQIIALFKVDFNANNKWID